MKLDHNCVRSLLLRLEDDLSYGKNAAVSSIEIDGFTNEEILYSSEKLIEAGYINGEAKIYTDSVIPYITISSITFTGHQFLDNIRDDNVWKNTKNVLSSFSSVSLGLVSNVATQVITSIINHQLRF